MPRSRNRRIRRASARLRRKHKDGARRTRKLSPRHQFNR